MGLLHNTQNILHARDVTKLGSKILTFRIRLLERAEILDDARGTRRERQVRLEASVRLGGILKRNAVGPDALFGLRFNDEEESYFMLEINRGEMPVERYKTFTERTSLKRC